MFCMLRHLTKFIYVFFPVTVISSIIIVVLIVSEFTAYWSIHISEELFVDTTRSHKLKINLDIYVPSISCDCKFLNLFVLSNFLFLLNGVLFHRFKS